MKYLNYLVIICLFFSCEKKVETKPNQTKVIYEIKSNDTFNFYDYRIEDKEYDNKCNKKYFTLSFNTMTNQRLGISGNFKVGSKVNMKIMLNDKVVKDTTFIASKQNKYYDYDLVGISYKLKKY